MRAMGRMSRRGVLSVAAGLVAARALRAQDAPKAKAASRITLTLTSRAALPYLPLTIAERLGYFRQEGVEIEFREPPAGALPIFPGPAEVVAGSFSRTLALQGRNAFFRAFALLCRTPQSALAVSSRALPAFSNLGELRDRPVAVGSEADAMHLRVALLRAGLPMSHVQVVELPDPALALAALRVGSVDAICHGEPVVTMLEHRAEVRVVADARTQRGAQEFYAGAMPGACLFAAESFIERNGEAVQALANAVTHALKWLQTAGPSDLVKVVPEHYMLGDRGLYLAAFNRVRDTIPPNGVLADEAARHALRVQSRAQSVQPAKPVVLARTYTNSFSQKARDKFIG